GRRDRHPTERAAAPLPADPDRDRSRTEYGDCLPGADRPGAATDRHPARQTPGADAARKILTLLTVRADLQTDLYIIAFVGVIIALYVLANFGERHATPRILTLTAAGTLRTTTSFFRVYPHVSRSTPPHHHYTIIASGPLSLAVHPPALA